MKNNNTQKYLIKNAHIIDPQGALDAIQDIFISPHGLVLSPQEVPDDTRVIDARGLLALPGLVDIHVHFRQPGNEHKETISTGTAAALAGGVTSVLVMPNTKPTLDSAQRVAEQLQLAKEASAVELMVAGAATHGLLGQEITDIEALKEAGAVAITDDGMPVMDDAIMEGVFRLCKKTDLVFMQHAEDLRLSKHGAMNDGVVSRQLGVTGQLASAESEMVRRDIRLAQEIGARYHVLHISCRDTVALVRDAKAKGLPVSCEVTPHHLFLTDAACSQLDPNKKMNPPLRTDDDRIALLEALADGTIDALASDHAPHAANEKHAGFEKAPYGVVGLETAFASLLTLVAQGIITLHRAVELMTTGPARVLRKEGQLGTLGGPAKNLVLVDPNLEWTLTDQELFGRSKNSAFLGMRWKGRVVATFLRGEQRFLLPGRLT